MQTKTERERREYYDNCIDIDGMTPEEATAATDEWATPRHPLHELSFAEMVAAPDAGWLVGDAKHPVLIADGVWMDYGPEKSGKTYRALELAFCIAFGIVYYGLPVRQGNVVYVIAEGGLARTVKRIRALCRKYKLQLRTMGYKTTADVLDAGKFNLIPSALDLSSAKAEIGILALLDQLQHRPYAALWMDTWARMLAASGGHSSDMDTVPLALRGCDIIRDRLGCAVVLVAHTPLSDTGRPKGLNEQTGNIDGATRCVKVGKGTQELFKFTSDFQRHGENDYCQVFHQVELAPDRVFEADSGGFDDAKLKGNPAALAALNILRAMEAGATVEEWHGRVNAADVPIFTYANTRQQWKDILARLQALDAIEIDDRTKVATPRPSL
jgi:hypothetical protein